MNTYLVALSVGGVQEHPEFSYLNYDVVEASNRDEAERLYNERHNCSYYYGNVMAEKVKGAIKVVNRSTPYEKVDLLKTK